MDTVEKIPDKKIFFIIGAFFGILILLAVAFMMLANARKNAGGPGGFFTGNNSDNTRNSNTPSGTPAPTYPPPPRLQTDEWIVSPQIQPTSILASQEYTLKQNYSNQEVRTFVEKLFFPQTFKVSQNEVLAYSLDPSTKDTESLRFDSQSGTFSFLTTKGISLASDSASTLSNEQVYNFLKTIDMYDPSIQVTAQYQKSTTPNLVYVELHRDWRRLGLPDLNMVGLMNIPENQNLTSLYLNSSSGLNPDNTIINATDGKNGLQRPDDFNSMTLIIDKQSGKLLAIKSNLRKIITAQTATKSLISVADAQAKLQSNSADMTLVYPSGQGIADWDKIYPDNQAVASQATVTDELYTYLEQPGLTAQSVLKPYVLFRGYAVLKNGYRTNFLAAIPAEQTSVLGASTEVDGGRLLAQQQNRGLGGGSTAPSSNTNSVPIPTASASCIDVHFRPAAFDRAVSFMGITLAHSPSFDYDKEVNGTWQSYHEDNGGHGDWYYIPAPNFNNAVLTADLQKINTNLIEFMQVIGNPNGEGEGFRNQGTDWTAVLNDVNHTWGDDRVNYTAGCPIRLTGHSPTILLYGNKDQTVQVKPSNTLYVDPSLTNQVWNVTINNLYDLSVNNIDRPYLYYEYSSVKFDKPKAGWNIDKSQLSTFITKISQQLGLNTTEKDRLTEEIQQGAILVSDNKIFVGLIDQNEVNKKLPVKFSPQPEKVYRYHFYISAVNGKVTAPKITPLQRAAFMSIELGVFTAQ